MNSNNFSFRSARGSALLTSILFTFLLMAVIAAVIQWSVTERRVTIASARWLETRNAAEAVAEYGLAQIGTQFNIHASPPSLDPAGTNPLVTPPASFWTNTGGNVDSNPIASDANGIELIGGTITQIPTAGLAYIDPTDPANQNDPLKGEYVYRRDIKVMAKTSVKAAEIGDAPITAYVEETISVRGAPLFANAIFYSNNDLEIFPGPTMNISGPVHVNGNLWLSSQGSSLNFSGGVASATGGFYHAWSNSTGAAEGTGGETLGQSPVTFQNSAGSAINADPTGTSTGWKDSTMGADNGLSGAAAVATVTSTTTTNFRQYANQTWNGNLQTAAMGVGTENPISFNEQVGVDGSGNAILANPHSIIDPPQTPVVTDPYYAQKLEVEQEKFSTRAGMYVKVTETTSAGSAPTAQIDIYGPSGSTQGNTAVIGPNGGPLVASTNASLGGGTIPAGLVTFNPYTATATSTVTNTAVASTVGSKISGGANNNKYPVTTTTTTNVSTLAASTYSAGSSSTTTPVSNNSSTTTTYVTNNPGASSSSSTSSTTPTTALSSGFYDNRRQMGVDSVDVDVSVLNAAVNAMVSGSTTGAITYKDSSGNPQVWGAGGSNSTPWNGGVYVDVEAPGVTATSTGYTYSSTQAASVRLINGETTSSSASLMPAYGANGNGFTVATNAPVYVKGNFNADGNPNTGSSTATDSGQTGAGSGAYSESPACIAGDAITILSNGWSDANSLTLDPTAAVGTNNGHATDSSGVVEIAAAMLTGITPTGGYTGGVYSGSTGTSYSSSGGAHNLPRFLENFGGKTVTIRGSLTCLYSSEIATQPWNSSYYSPPARNWGFDTIFQNGHFPPLTPKVISFRRYAFTSVSAAQYAADKHALWPTEY